jgi:arsenate reductase (thioredoxin)
VKKPMRVLFVCVGNACRSQMAEAFARTYGSDVIEAESAGMMPASIIPPVTRKVMTEKGIDLGEQFPKGIFDVPLHDIEMVVNMSGMSMHGITVPQLREWKVRDPMGARESVHREVRDEVERLVMNLVLELRRV